MSLAPGTPIGRYVIRRKLAEGGMAEIFLAQSRGPEGFEKQVVIKRIRSVLADDPSFVQMFIAEARVASRLNHANIVHIFDFDRHEDTYYLAMEYVRGKSLADVNRRARDEGRSFPQLLAAQVGLEVARGLAYAHKLTEHGQSLGLVHRDVTPHNVLVSFEGAVKLTDFGIAKASNRASTAGMLKGKFAYMAPEQARGEPVDARTDIFALGITLWELLAGTRLFDGESDVAVLRAVQERPIQSPREFNPETDAALSALVMRALQRDAAQRYQTAGDFERALLQYVIGGARTPEDTDVGSFVRSLFAEEAATEEESGPAVPLQLIALTDASAPRSRPSHRAAASSERAESERMLQQTIRSGGSPVPMEDEALAPTRGKTPRAQSRPTTPGAQSAVTRAPPRDEASVLAAQLGRRSRRMGLALLGVAALATVAGVAFLAGRSGSRADVTGTSLAPSPAVPGPRAGPNPPPEPPAPSATPAPPTPAPPAPASSATPAGVVVPAAAPTPPVGPPGFLVVRVQPWGKLYVDGKFHGDIEGTSHRLSLDPGPHVVRLANGRKAKSWNVEIESGKTDLRSHSFIDE